jgi:hypothetical protein
MHIRIPQHPQGQQTSVHTHSVEQTSMAIRPASEGVGTGSIKAARVHKIVICGLKPSVYLVNFCLTCDFYIQGILLPQLNPLSR